jgi:hypothetical protein
MTDRNATAAWITQAEASANRPVHLLELVFDSATTRLTDADRTITWGGNDYLALGHFLGFSDIEESSEVEVTSMTGTLSGVDQTYVSLFLSETYLDRPVNLYKAFLDAGLGVVSDPLLIFSGRLNQPVINENPDDGTCTLAISATSHWVDFERRPGRHTNHAEQQVWFPGDKGFEFSSEIVKEIRWGRS